MFYPCAGSLVQVSGFEYLDKIAQIPFAIPPLVDLEKTALCRGYLTGSRCVLLA